MVSIGCGRAKREVSAILTRASVHMRWHQAPQKRKIAVSLAPLAAACGSKRLLIGSSHHITTTTDRRPFEI